MKTLKFFILVSMVVLTSKVAAQQVPLFSQYLFNGFLVNPAYAGLDGLSAVNLTTREDFVGMPNAPQTYLVSFQTRVLRNSFVRKSASARRKAMNRYTSGRVGIGGFVFSDILGPIKRTGAQITYAYHLKLYNGATVSMAMSGSIHQFYLDKSKTKLSTGSDRYLDNKSLNMFMPDAGFGAVYSAKQYYFGLSIDQLLQSYLKVGSNMDNNYQLHRQYHITGGYRFEIDKLTAIEPSMLLKTSEGSLPQVDVSCKYVFNRDYWGGLSFRSGTTTASGSASVAAIVISGGLSYERYHFGYAFDYNLSGLGQYTYGSHEFMVAYKFGDNASRLRWLNR
jgi:type IX secretion system PorP/SprF family membrane protein